MNVTEPTFFRHKARMALLLISIAVVTTIPHVKSWNDASRMATVQSLVEHHTFVIDQSVFANTGDKVFIKGHFYSDKPVAPAVLGALVYWPLFQLHFSLDYGWNFAYFVITFIIIKGFWLAGLLAFYGALSQASLDVDKRIWLTAALGIASLYFTWASTFNNHILAAAQLMIGFYFFLQAKQGLSLKRNLFLAGLFFSLAGTMDIPTGVFYVAFLGYLFMQASLRRIVFFYLLPVTVTVLPSLMLNFFVAGSIIPLQLNKDYFDYPGSPWIGSSSLSGMSVNDLDFSLHYGFAALFGTKGFMLYNPFLFIALPYLGAEILHKRAFSQEAILIGGTSAIMVLYYFLFTNNFAGDSYSIRWFVPLLPLLFFFMHPFFVDFSKTKRRLFFTIFIFSAVIASIGVISAWSRAALSDTPVLSNLIELRQSLDRFPVSPSPRSRAPAFGS